MANIVNLADIYAKVDAAKAQQAAQQANQMRMEQAQYEIGRQRQADQRDDAVRGVYSNAIENINGVPTLNEKRLLSDLYRADPERALATQEKFTQRDAAAAKTKSETAKAELENRKATAAYLRDRLSQVQDQSTYDAVMQEAAELGAGFIKGAPREFNPEFVRSQLFTADEFLKQSTPKYEKVDLGGKIQVIDVNPMTNPSIKGTQFDKTLTPEAILTDQRTRYEGALNRGVTMRGQNMVDERSKQANDMPKAPPGYKYLPDGSLEAIKGGPADIKAGELGAKADARKKMQLGTTENTINAVDTALKQAGFFETGMTGAAMGKIAGSDAYNLRRTAETIKANLGFNELQAMREASPTGGALGAIAVQELTALQSTIANIDPNQSEAQLKENLKKVRKHVNAWRKTMGGQEIPEQKEAGQLPRGATRDVRSEADKILGL